MKAKKKYINRRDLLLGFLAGFFLAIIIASIINAYIFRQIITAYRIQSDQIKFLLELN